MDLYGPKIAVVCGLNGFTYPQFGERCERLAAGLLARGIKPGDRAAYLSFGPDRHVTGLQPAIFQHRPGDRRFGAWRCSNFLARLYLNLLRCLRRAPEKFEVRTPRAILAEQNAAHTRCLA